ncbi:glycosyltransferase [Endozoicomonas sp. 8E]|uniref:glycosyltransferase n=1 Tax=Endozoicomonas sp. 8E TaxID=3035692 RepID=UPI00293929E7|nr:glycosyltransferase [Endozoicomonas sp. 8E]WOG26346.1 glycosyltransferase [Endozoicomonas sp. 8E]
MNVLAILPGFIPSTIIGILKPLAKLEQQGEIKLRVRLHKLSLFISYDIKWCDVAVFCRNCECEDLSVLYELKKMGKKVVYEIDDNFEEIPLTTEIGIYHRSFFRLHVLKRFFELSDVTRVYSKRMFQRATAHGAHPQLIRGYFDESMFDGLSRRPSDGIVRIAYPTGRIDDQKLEKLIFTALQLILARFSERIEVHLWRKSLPEELRGVKGVVLHSITRRYDRFIRSFYQAGFDIGLAPGIDNPFFHSKTNNKYREFAGCGIAGAYSNILPYSDSVIHEHSGLLVGSTPNEWATAIERLVLNDDLRSRIIKNATNDVLSNYSFKKFVQSWRLCLFQRLLQKNESPEWLFSPKQVTVFNLVQFPNKQSKTDQRYEYFHLAMKMLPNSLFEQFNGAASYLKSGCKKKVCASIFLINNDADIRLIAKLLPVTTSAIIDTVAYEGDIEKAIGKLWYCATNLPISFIVSTKQAKVSLIIQSWPGLVLTVEPEEPSISHEFSLSGYPAAYLDLLEKHIRYAPLMIKSTRIVKFIDRTAHRYQIWKTRFESLTMFIKLLLGSRKF